YNYWGPAATASMNTGGNPKDIDVIYDYYDEGARGEVNYAGWLDSEGGSPTSSGSSGLLRLTNNSFNATEFYENGDSVFIEVVDPDIDSTGSPETLPVKLLSGTELSWESVLLTETGAASDTFRGFFPFEVGGTPVDDNALQINYGDSIVVRYDDARDDYGLSATVTAMAVFANTVVDTLSGTTHWTIAGSPYLVIQDMAMPSGDTLYVYPGVEVRFQVDPMDRRQLDIDGVLQSNGTADSLIRFISNSYAPGKGDWQGLRLNSAGPHVLDYSLISHGIEGLLYNHSSLDTGTVVKNSVVRHCSNNGVLVNSGDASLKIENSVIDSCGNMGVSLSGNWIKQVLIRNSVICDNASYGIYLDQNSGDCHVDITGDSISGNGDWGIYIHKNNEGEMSGRLGLNWISGNANGVNLRADNT
ncbi:MAG: right-handed parallel beta-helix repeat-containing protein, partial [Planctomycetes bacterium]|nr:right-handed parallel beta-helix repeat-containing protein [Planctomycetota bacterium]